jgi:hypothetical protein
MRAVRRCEGVEPTNCCRVHLPVLASSHCAVFAYHHKGAARHRRIRPLPPRMQCDLRKKPLVT